MARRFRKSSTRRGAKRSRSMTNYAIATRTSAKAQSRQIYYLKKRINYIQRRTKPEIVTVQQTANQIVLNGDSLASNVTWNSGSVTSQYIYPYLGSHYPIQDGTATANTPNSFARLLSFNLYGNLQYATISEVSVPIALRIIIVQTRTTRQSVVNSSDIFTSGGAFNRTYGPLQTGLARTCKVLSDKRYQLTYQRPNITIKTSLKYLLPFYRDPDQSEVSPKGAIFVFYSVYSQTESTNANLNLMCKLAYTDA